MIGNKLGMNLTEVKEGDVLRFKGNSFFSCLKCGAAYTVFKCESDGHIDQLYITCSSGNHFLNGHADDAGEFNDFMKQARLRLVVNNEGCDAPRKGSQVLPGQSDRHSAADYKDQARRKREDIGLRSVRLQAETVEGAGEEPSANGG